MERGPRALFIIFCLDLSLVAGASRGVSARAEGEPSEPSIRGAWSTRSYILKDGTEHAVKGHIFFAEKEWTVLFFVVDENGPQRASAEGGTYTLEGEKLVFTHLYHLASGKAVRGLPESPLRMEVRPAGAAPTEPCTIRIDGHRLRIDFPSGNAMTFERSSVS